MLLVHPGGPFWVRRDEGARGRCPKGEVEAGAVQSNTFMLEWPRGSKRMQEFPEVDRAGWFPLDEARVKLLNGQRPLLDRLADIR